MEIRFNPQTFIGKLVYLFLLIVLPLVMLTACFGTEPANDIPKDPAEDTVIVMPHPRACIAGDTAIKYLETYPLKIGVGTRNRCHTLETGIVQCKAKSPDTLYNVVAQCPIK